MKLIFIFITTLFFTTQIIPVRYVKNLFAKTLTYQNESDDCDSDEEDETSDKLKEKSAKEIKLLKDHFSPAILLVKIIYNQHFHFNVNVKNNHSRVVPTPPPNC